MKQNTGQHPMAVVTRRTGLRADVIRAWERRHNVVEPTRSPGNHRLYSDEDIRRLLLIRRAVESGWQIGQIANLGNDDIESMVEEAAALTPPAPRRGKADDPVETILDRCMARIEDLDGDGLRRELETASVTLGRIQLFEQSLAPLLERIGQACAEGKLRIAHEHLASAAIRSFLDSLRPAFPVSESAPELVVTTPTYQHHELAAMLVASTASNEGWKTTYLGANLPAEEIAAAVDKPGVRVLALSITNNANDPQLDQELRKIGRLVPKHVTVVVGGRAAGGYRDALSEIGAIRIGSLAEFRKFLRVRQVTS